MQPRSNGLEEGFLARPRVQEGAPILRFWQAAEFLNFRGMKEALCQASAVAQGAAGFNIDPYANILCHSERCKIV